MGSRVRVPSGPPETKVFGSLWIKDFFILIQGVEILLKMICTCPKMKPFRWRTEWKLWGYEVSIKTKKTWKIFFQVFFCGQWWIRTTEGESQLSYSQPHLATLVTAHSNTFFWASCRIRTNDPEITNHVLWPTELKRRVGKLAISRRYNQLPLLRSSPGGFEGSWPYRTYPFSFCGCKGRHYFEICNSLRRFFYLFF